MEQDLTNVQWAAFWSVLEHTASAQLAMEQSTIMVNAYESRCRTMIDVSPIVLKMCF